MASHTPGGLSGQEKRWPNGKHAREFRTDGDLLSLARPGWLVRSTLECGSSSSRLPRSVDPAKGDCSTMKGGSCYRTLRPRRRTANRRLCGPRHFTCKIGESSEVVSPVRRKSSNRGEKPRTSHAKAVNRTGRYPDIFNSLGKSADRKGGGPRYGGMGELPRVLMYRQGGEAGKIFLDNRLDVV